MKLFQINSKDRDQVRRLLEIIINEKAQASTYSQMLIANSLSSVLTIISSKLISKKEKDDNKFSEIIQHINENIINENQLSIVYLSEKFNISNKYFSEYFRRNADESLKEYIQKTKLQIAVNRIKYTQNSLQEIAWSLGFTDGSHLNRVLKKYFGFSSSALKKDKK